MTGAITERDRRVMGNLARNEITPRDIPDFDTEAPPEHRDFARKKIPEHIQRRINELDKAGHTAGEISRRLSVARRTVQRYAEDIPYDQPTEHDRSCIDQRRCNVIRANRADGVACADIAELLDCDASTVTYHARGECACNAEVEPVSLPSEHLRDERGRFA